VTAFRRAGDPQKRKYEFESIVCLGFSCWAPGLAQKSRIGAGGGKPGPAVATCLNRAHRGGCPSGLVHSEDLARKRRNVGWARA
jgi:hypothetical protein